MPLDPAIKKVLVIGAGPITIGQACEFDYSGTQACKALKEEGCKVILINSNPASIMTDTEIADSIYIEPITADVIERIIRQESPDSLLPTMGGQTALNCAKSLFQTGILEKYSITLIGVTLETIEKAENRKRFKEEMEKSGIAVPVSFSATCWKDAVFVQNKLQYPVVVRTSFTLGGQGGNIAYNLSELKQICEEGFSISHHLQIEESLIGWKEFELEIMRDRKGNCLVVCGIENVDPMGVHTGDSITVSPIQTLTDKEYQLMRMKAFQVMDSIGMESGGCNVQFAVDPKTGRMLCIEINPRVSRSSALASKATGYPIAKIAAKIALGYNLDELKNKVASFPPTLEPAIDYVVIKIPRFNFDKFPSAAPHLSTHMKSVGEVMAIGRTFKESLNKAISSLDIPPVAHGEEQAPPFNLNGLKQAHDKRLWHVMEALRKGMSVNELHALTHYDPWFLTQIQELVEEEDRITTSSIQTVSPECLFHWKQMGFSDQRLVLLLKGRQHQVEEKRKQLSIYPVYKRIDPCSGEFPNHIACMYSTYEEECESRPSDEKKILIIGSGPNRIGQGIEFDYCCVHAVKAARDMGYETIMINCNPETVSTDYDQTDRLYFEPLTLEHILEVIRREKPFATLIQMGGQTALNIGKLLDDEGIALLGTSFDSLDLAEDRSQFCRLAERIGLQQPRNESFRSAEEALKKADMIEFPMILRPSYVIGGQSIKIIWNAAELRDYLQTLHWSSASPVLMEEFLDNAMEVEVDAICDGSTVFICGIIEHIEPAGIHSGDSMSFLSPCHLSQGIQEDLIEQTTKIGLSLNVLGMFNVQFAIRNNILFVLEVNPRASRTIPLLCKTTGLPLVRIAMECMLGKSLKEQNVGFRAEPRFFGLKLPVFPFSSLQLKNETLGPEMKSTGEVLCIGKTFDELLWKARKYAMQTPHLFTGDMLSRLPKPGSSFSFDLYNIAELDACQNNETLSVLDRSY